MENESDKNHVIQGPYGMAHAVGKLRNRKNKPKQKHSTFDRRYTALGPLLKPEWKRIDYVLVHKVQTSEDIQDEEKKNELSKLEEMRDRFEAALEHEGFSIMPERIDDFIYKKLHVSFKRLCEEAEAIKLEMPLLGKEAPPEVKTHFITRCIENHFDTEKDEVDYVSAPFRMNKIDLYQDYENPTKFFRPALRSYLAHNIMRNIDIRDTSKDNDKVRERKKTADDLLDVEAHLKVVVGCMTDFCMCCPCYGRDEENPDNIVLSKMGLPYMLMKNVYVDAFVLHEDSALSQANEVKQDDTDKIEEKKELIEDPRKSLDETWCSFWKFQPTWRIRNYFGEKIAFYFAWAGWLMTSLWIPMFFGLACFGYGLHISILKNNNADPIPPNSTTEDAIKRRLAELYDEVSGSFDNNITPYFALGICLWGTVFLEFWKRYNARLAYEWDVDQFETNEPDLPEFFGTKIKPDPVTQEANWFYPFKRQVLKFAISTSVLLFMILMVFIFVAAVVVYRVIISVDYCTRMTAASCLVTSSLVAAVLNAVCIFILGKIYDWVALKFTQWENHRTQTQFDDALVLKLFAFSFANSYSSCFYIAFVRGNLDGGLFGLGSEYNDPCEGESGSCMSQLSFQVLILMLAKPIPKFLMDIVMPFIRRSWRSCTKRLCDNKVTDNKERSEEPEDIDSERAKCFLRKERMKPPLGDFTLSEYNEKVIIYGFLMLFATAFPLAPLIALAVLYLDKYIDAKRLLWWNRRPIAHMAQDIGMWYSILNFVNLISVISNGFLIAFTSSWGRKYNNYEKLLIVIIFEHIVFALKFLLAYLIPDVPKDVRLSIRREKFQVAKYFEEKGKITNYTELVPAATHDMVRPDSANFGRFPLRFGDTDEETNGQSFNKGSNHRIDHELSTVMEEETSPEIKPHPQDTHSTTVSLRGVNPEGSLLNKSLDNLSLGESSTSGRVASPRRPMYGQKSVNFKEPIPTPKYNPGKLDNHDESEDSSNEGSSESEVDSELEHNSDIHAAKKRQTSQ